MINLLLQKQGNVYWHWAGGESKPIQVRLGKVVNLTSFPGDRLYECEFLVKGETHNVILGDLFETREDCINSYLNWGFQRIRDLTKAITSAEEDIVKAKNNINIWEKQILKLRGMLKE